MALLFKMPYLPSTSWIEDISSVLLSETFLRCWIKEVPCFLIILIRSFSSKVSLYPSVSSLPYLFISCHNFPSLPYYNYSHAHHTSLFTPLYPLLYPPSSITSYSHSPLPLHVKITTEHPSLFHYLLPFLPVTSTHFPPMCTYVHPPPLSMSQLIHDLPLSGLFLSTSMYIALITPLLSAYIPTLLLLSLIHLIHLYSLSLCLDWTGREKWMTTRILVEKLIKRNSEIRIIITISIPDRRYIMFISILHYVHPHIYIVFWLQHVLCLLTLMTTWTSFKCTTCLHSGHRRYTHGSMICSVVFPS